MGGGEFDWFAADAVHFCVLPAVFYSGADAGRGEGVAKDFHLSPRENEDDRIFPNLNSARRLLTAE